MSCSLNFITLRPHLALKCLLNFENFLDFYNLHLYKLQKDVLILSI